MAFDLARSHKLKSVFFEDELGLVRFLLRMASSSTSINLSISSLQMSAELNKFNSL